MTTENILKEMSDAIKLNNESKVTTNEALCHAGNVIRSLEKKLKEEYQRGCKDAWDLACDICGSTAFGGMNAERLDMVFGTADVEDIMDKHSYENAKKKIDEFLVREEEENEKAEEEPIVRGDEVFCEGRYCQSFKGIYIGEGIVDFIWVLSYDNEAPQQINKSLWTITKTGKHVDLDF